MNSMTRRITVASLLWCAGACCGQTQIGATWTGNGGAWFNGANWDCQGGGGCIPNNGATFTYWVLLTGGQGCFLDGSPTIDRIGMDVSTTLVHQNNRTFTIVGDTDGSGAYGTFSIVGATYEMDSVGNNTNLVVTGGPDATLFIGGETNLEGRVQMSDSTSNRIYGASGTETVHFTRDLEVWGSGNIGANSARVINEGCVFRATQAQPMILDPADNLEWLNESFVIAEFAGTVQVNPGLFNNVNGWLGANSPDARLLINGGTVVGGVVQSGSGLLQLHGGSISGTTTLFGSQQTGQGGGLVTANSSIEDMINHGVLTIANNVQGLHVLDEIRNFGQIVLASVGNATDLIIESDLLLTSGGEVRMENEAARIYGSDPSFRLTNFNNLIRGAGRLGENGMLLDNLGEVRADVAGRRLRVDGAAGEGVNWGIMRASGGGILRIEPYTFDQGANGLIEALDGSLVELVNCTIIGGEVSSAGAGAVRVAGPSTRLIGVANDGLIEVPNNTQGLRIQNALVNRGVVHLLSVGNATDLIIENNVTLAGGGEVVMQSNGSSANRIYASGGAFTLTNADNRIRGDGNLGENTTEIVNSATIAADLSGRRLEIDPASSCVNAGLLEATGGGELRLLPGAFDNASGAIAARAGSNVNIDGAVVTGGTIVAEPGGNLQLDGGVVAGAAPTIAGGATGTITAGGAGFEGGLDNAGVVTIANNVQGTRFGGLFNNSGAVVLDSVGNATEFRLIDNVTLAGGGAFVLDPGGGSGNRVLASVGTLVLDNTDNEIRGEGRLGNNSLTLVNGGLIAADAPGRTLELDTSGGTTNTGAMRAEGGGVLRIDPDTYTQVGGTIEALDGSVAQLNGCTIVGGTLATDGTGEILVSSGSTRLVGVSSTARIEVPNNTQGLRVQGALVNDGAVHLRSVGNATELICEGDVLLDGSGEIVMHDGGGRANRVRAEASDQTITIRCDIRGSGGIGANSAQIVNEGRIISDGAAGIEIDASGTGTRNRGLVHATGTAPLTIQPGPFINEDGGTVLIADGATLDRRGGDLAQAGGDTLVDGRLLIGAGSLAISGGAAVVSGVLEASGGAVVTGGLLAGDGVVLGDVTNAGGRVAPGQFSGMRVVDDLTVVGEYTQADGATLGVTLLSAEVNSGLSVTGVASIDGALVVTNAPGFDPPFGTSYEVLDAAGVIGVFSSVDDSALPTGKAAHVDYLPTRVVVTIVEGACAGDWNGDGTVNTQDFLAYLNDWSTQREDNCTSGGCSADLNGDGTVNSQDFLLFLNLWSAGC